MKILSIIRQFLYPHPTGLDLKLMKQRDERQYSADELGTWFGGYTPKHVRKINETISVKNQKQLNTCVVESGALQKEPDEGVELDEQWMAAHLYNLRKMSWKGTSLEAFQNALYKVGIPPKDKTRPDEHHLSFEQFARKSLLSLDSYTQAAEHKSKSYWDTTKLDTIIQWIDEGRIWQAGCEWFTGYNPSQVKKPWILEPQKGYSVGGHAFDFVGYDLEYEGQKVVVCETSYDKQYNNGRFYIRFEDFGKIINFPSFVNLDFEKDVAAFLSLNAGKAILSKVGPKVYIIESDKKRWVPDEAMLNMLEIPISTLIHDKEDILSQVKEGEEMSINDIPKYKLELVQYFVGLMADRVKAKETYGKYFPQMFKS